MIVLNSIKICKISSQSLLSTSFLLIPKKNNEKSIGMNYGEKNQLSNKNFKNMWVQAYIDKFFQNCLTSEWTHNKMQENINLNQELILTKKFPLFWIWTFLTCVYVWPLRKSMSLIQIRKYKSGSSNEFQTWSVSRYTLTFQNSLY